MLSDPTKLGLLGACLTACLSTLFTSSSFLMAHQDLKVLGAPLQRHCRAPRQQAQQCLEAADNNEEEEQSCTMLLSQVTQCEASVTKAYRHVNMAGCPRQIQAVTVCQVEWCDGVQGTNPEAMEACSRECKAVSEKLEECIAEHVQSYFERYNLQKDGTFKQK